MATPVAIPANQRDQPGEMPVGQNPDRRCREFVEAAVDEALVQPPTGDEDPAARGRAREIDRACEWWLPIDEREVEPLRFGGSIDGTGGGPTGPGPE